MEWTVAVMVAVAALVAGWVLAGRRDWSKAMVSAFVGGMTLGAAGAAGALSNPGAGDLPWGAVVAANLVVGLVAVSIVTGLAAGAKLALERVVR